jgi:hypothetical protein
MGYLTIQAIFSQRLFCMTLTYGFGWEMLPIQILSNNQLVKQIFSIKFYDLVVDDNSMPLTYVRERFDMTSDDICKLLN